MDDAKDEIQRRLAGVKTFLAREAPPRLSESDTKANFIEPIIAALGWEGIGVVTREYYVRNSQEFIDYVMTGPSWAPAGDRSKTAPNRVDRQTCRSAHPVLCCGRYRVGGPDQRA